MAASAHRGAGAASLGPSRPLWRPSREWGGQKAWWASWGRGARPMSSRRSKYAQEAAEADDLDEESSALVYIKDEIYGYIPARIVYMTEDSYEVGVIVSIELPFPREQWLSELSINQSNIRPNQDISIESGTERDVLLQDYPNMKLPLQNRDYQFNTLYNLRNLEHLNEASILYALKGRYLSSEDEVLPYTRCGSSTIVAFNPFKFVSSLYIDDVLQSYTPSAEAFKSIEKDGKDAIMKTSDK